MINTNIRKMIFLILILTAIITASISYAAIGYFEKTINGINWEETYRIHKVRSRKEYTLQLNNPSDGRRKIVVDHKMYNYYNQLVSDTNKTYEGTKTTHKMKEGDPGQEFYLRIKRENWWDWYAKVTGRFSPDRF